MIDPCAVPPPPYPGTQTRAGHLRTWNAASTDTDTDRGTADHTERSHRQQARSNAEEQGTDPPNKGETVTDADTQNKHGSRHTKHTENGSRTPPRKAQQKTTHTPKKRVQKRITHTKRSREKAKEENSGFWKIAEIRRIPLLDKDENI